MQALYFSYFKSMVSYFLFTTILSQHSVITLILVADNRSSYCTYQLVQSKWISFSVNEYSMHIIGLFITKSL